MSRRRLIAVLVFGAVGVAVLLALGQWQLRRLAWKEAVIGEIETRLADDPAALPEAPEEARDEYLRVAVDGRFAEGEVHVLTTLKPDGPGFRVIAPFEIEGGRRILVDRGYVPEAAKAADRPLGAATVVGSLLWPDEVDSYTPAPDRAGNFWFARDVAPMAEALGALPILVVAETALAGGPRPVPVTVEIPNDHLQYALTWFALALVWFVMTVLLVRRELRRELPHGGD